MPSFSLQKCVCRSYNQSHPNYNETEGVKYTCNVLLAVCCSNVWKLPCWSSLHLDHVLDLGDNFLKNLELNMNLDVPDLPDHVSLYGYPCDISDINKIRLHDGEAAIGAIFLSFSLVELLD